MIEPSVAESLKLVIPIFSVFMSLLGVFVVFRLNTLHANIRENFGMLRGAIESLNQRYRLTLFSYREMTDTIFEWLGNKEDAMRGQLFRRCHQPMDIAFKNMAQRISIVRRFVGLLIVLGLSLGTSLFYLFPFVGPNGPNPKAILIFLLAILVIGLVIAFIRSSLLLTDWKHWESRIKQWDGIVKGFSESEHTQQ